MKSSQIQDIQKTKEPLKKHRDDLDADYSDDEALACFGKARGKRGGGLGMKHIPTLASFDTGRERIKIEVHTLSFVDSWLKQIYLQQDKLSKGKNNFEKLGGLYLMVYTTTDTFGGLEELMRAKLKLQQPQFPKSLNLAPATGQKNPSFPYSTLYLGPQLINTSYSLLSGGFATCGHKLEADVVFTTATAQAPHDQPQNTFEVSLDALTLEKQLIFKVVLGNLGADKGAAGSSEILDQGIVLGNGQTK